jgi:hypothetical protein
MHDDTMRERGLIGNTIDKYMFNQSQGLCNLADNDYLCAVLQNKNLPYNVAENFIFHHGVPVKAKNTTRLLFSLFIFS